MQNKKRHEDKKAKRIDPFCYQVCSKHVSLSMFVNLGQFGAYHCGTKGLGGVSLQKTSHYHGQAVDHFNSPC